MRHLSFYLSLAVMCILLGCTRASDMVEIAGGRQAYVKTALSDDNVKCFAIDSLGRMWIGTSYGLNYYDGNRYRQYFFADGDSLSLPGNDINCLYTDSEGRLWVGTSCGLACYSAGETFVRWHTANGTAINVAQIIETTDHRIFVRASKCIYEATDQQTLTPHPALDGTMAVEPDAHGGLWAFLCRRYIHYTPKGNTFAADKTIDEPLGSNMVTSASDSRYVWAALTRELICIDRQTGRLVFRTPQCMDILPQLIFPVSDGALLKSDRHGLFRFSLKTGTISSYDDFHLTSTEAKDISSIYRDADGNYWTGFYGSGFRVLNTGTVSQQILNDNTLYNATHHENIVAMATGPSGEIWGATHSRMFRYTPSTDALQTFEQSDILVSGPYYRQILKKIIPDGDRLWLLTNARISLAAYNGGIVTRRSWRFWQSMGDCCVAGGHCYVVAEGRKMFVVDDQLTDSIAISTPKYNGNARLLTLSDGHILVATEGLELLTVDPHSHAVTPLTVEQSRTIPTGTLPTALLQDAHGTVWITTKADGLFRLDLTTHRLTTVPQLPVSGILSIAEQDGKLWMGTGSGLLEYSPSLNTCMLHTLGRNKLSAYCNCSEQALCQLDGRLVIGTHDGCIQVAPEAMLKPLQPRPLVYSVCVISHGSDRLVMGKDDNHHFVVAHNDNDLRISFGDIAFAAAPQHEYEFCLEGVDNDWQHSGSYRDVVYSNVPAGKYRFRVRVVQAYGTEPIAETSAEIIVKPAPWLTLPAKMTYALLAFLLVYLVNRLYLRARVNRLALQSALAEKERERHTGEMNMSFFANISHEFRNPLTMISGPVQSLCNNKTLPGDVRRKLLMIRRSSKAMLRLVDQMMDFNRLETDALKLRVQQCDVVNDLNVILDTFEVSAAERGIRVEREGLGGSLFMLYDRDKIEKIMANLLTNALKHTDDGGIVRVSFSNADTDGQCRIVVFNNGKPIPEAKLADVFKRFYQVKDVNGNHTYGWGTGIGLYYVSRLVQLHHGHISVANATGGGVAFTVSLPCRDNVYADDEHLTDGDSMPHMFLSDDTAADALLQTDTPDCLPPTAPTLLIVDDDIEMARYLRTLFADKFRVVNKYSAESALEWLTDNAPDIILSDVVMGEMSGYELCRRLKTDMAYSHIPVILITAKAKVDEQIEGLRLNANGYVTKPFNPDYLKALVEAQLNNINNIRQRLNEGDVIEVSADGLSAQDSEFLKQLTNLMEAHLSDSELNIDTICHDMLISRSKLYYKMKSLTGETPNNFFKNYRLNQAARLLREGRRNVSEVAMDTGFGTLSYFSSCFKKKFGVSPSEYC